MATKLVHNERIKILASILSNIGVAFLVAAGIAPLITAQTTLNLTYLFTLPVGIALCACCGALASIVLGDLWE